MTRTRLGVTLLVATFAWLASPPPILACSTCYGQADGPMIDAAQLGTWLLLGVVLSVQVAFAAFFLHLRRRAVRHGQGTSEATGSGQPGEWGSA
jgi:hypothetical protein